MPHGRRAKLRRPSLMRFSDVIGQKAIKDRLLTMAGEGRLPHAMLLMGDEGAGALPLAMALAQYIDCTGDKSHGDSCGTCPACQKVARMVHPDVHYIFPIAKNGSSDDTDTYLPEWRQTVTRTPYFGLQEWVSAMASKKRTEAQPDDDKTTATGTGKQALIAKDAAQAIHAKLSMKPYEADKQIMIIWKPELMNETTSNSLLKILEEPPTDTLFIMVSEDAAQILPTILSRAQTFRVPPIEEEDMKAALMRSLGMAPAEAGRMAHIAQGSYVTATRLLGNAETATQNLQFFKEMMRVAWTDKPEKVIRMNTLADQCRAMTRDQVKNLLAYCQHMVRESFIMNLCESRINFLTQAEEEFLLKFAQFVHIGNAERIAALIDDTTARVEQNANVRMVMKSMMMSLSALIKRIKRPSAEPGQRQQA